MRKPSAIDEVCANDSDLKYSDWTEERLSRVLSETLDLYQRTNECVFFFIDGLDEFEGDFSKLLKVILPIRLRRNVRSCLSSRPLDALQQYLQSYATIRLEDLNYPDIEQFVSSELEAVDYLHKDHMKEIPSRAQGIFLWAALVTRELIKCYQEDHPKATLQAVLEDLPEGLEPLFNSLFSRVDSRSHDFLLLIFQVLNDFRSNWKIDLACITACLHHKNVSSLHDFMDHCQKVQRRKALRSKGLLEVNSARYRPKALRGWALEDPSTHKPRQTALTDDEVHSWMMFAWPTVNWLHRSAYDYIFNSPKADLPTWIREINIAQDLLAGCTWLFRNGLLLFAQDGVTFPLGSDVIRITRCIMSQTDQALDGVYQTLDALCGLLEVSLSEQSWLHSEIHAHLKCTREISCSIVAQTSMGFWIALRGENLQDYILSRFHLLKHGLFSHVACFDLLSVASSPQLVRLVLDVLTEKASSPLSNAISYTQDAQAYRCALDWSNVHCSWLSHGESCEARKMYQLHRFIFVELIRKLPSLSRAYPDETREQAFPDGSPASCVPDLTALVDYWQLYSAPDRASDSTGSQLEVHFSVSHALKCMNTGASSESGTPMRLLGTRERIGQRGLQSQTIGFIPICIFHTSPTTYSVLSRSLETQPPSAKTSTSFRGPLDAFLECRETLVEEILEDAANQLDASQQRCLLVLVQISFFRHWTIENW